MRFTMIALFCFGFALTTSAEVPQQLHYNGYLTNAVGEAVNCPDPLQCENSFDFVFRLYSSSAGGSPIWEETYPAMPIFGGSFYAVLGTINPIDSEVLNGPTWLSVRVNENPEMEPRQKITSAAYALVAERAEQANVADDATKLGGVEATDYASQDSLNAIQTSLSLVATEGLPSDLSDGDDDTLGSLICSEGMVPKMTALGWACGADEAGGDDTTLSEEEVDAMVANNGYALASELFSGDYNDLINQPADADTQLTEEEVDAMVANNGYAAHSDLESAQSALTALQTLVSELQTSTGVDVSALQDQISVLQTKVATLETAGLTVTADLEECSSVKTGALRYNAEIVEICNGTEWVAIYTPPEPVLDGTAALLPGVTCQGLLDAGFSTGNGFYWIDPDNDADHTNSFQVHCDMNNNGGGWTHVATLSNVDGVRSWSHTSPQFSAWLDNTSLVSTTPSLDGDYKSRAYGELNASQLMIITDKGVSGTWSGVNGTLLARISAEASNCVSAPPDSGRILPNVSASHGSLARDIWLATSDDNSIGSCALSNQSNPSDSAVLTFADTKNYGVGNGDGWQGIGQSWEQNIKNTREPAVTCATATDCFEDFVSAYGWEEPSNDEAFIHTVFNDGNVVLEPNLILLYVR